MDYITQQYQSQFDAVTFDALNTVFDKMGNDAPPGIGQFSTIKSESIRYFIAANNVILIKELPLKAFIYRWRRVNGLPLLYHRLCRMLRRS
jgi:hypothetical protein